MNRREDECAGDDVGRTQPVVEEVRIDSGRHALAGTLHRPASEADVAIVLHGATGVPQSYYQAFAAWLAAEHGHAVLTYDYRDFGASASGRLRHSRATMAEWGVHDQSAALDWLAARFPTARLRVIGHSLGAQYLGWHENVARVERFLAVASGPAYWRDHPTRFMAQVLYFWFLGGPIVTRLAGYLPGRLLGLGSDLPAGVYWQWRRWCLSPAFNRPDWGTLLPEPNFERGYPATVAIAIADDAFMPPQAVRRLDPLVPGGDVEHRLLAPADIGARSIGHVRVFSARCANAWPRLAEALAGEAWPCRTAS